MNVHVGKTTGSEEEKNPTPKLPVAVKKSSGRLCESRSCRLITPLIDRRCNQSTNTGKEKSCKSEKEKNYCRHMVSLKNVCKGARGPTYLDAQDKCRRMSREKNVQ